MTGCDAPGFDRGKIPSAHRAKTPRCPDPNVPGAGVRIEEDTGLQADHRLQMIVATVLRCRSDTPHGGAQAVQCRQRRRGLPDRLMDKAQFPAALAALCLNCNEFADLTGLRRATIYTWGGRNPIPPPARRISAQLAELSGVDLDTQMRLPPAVRRLRPTAPVSNAERFRIEGATSSPAQEPRVSLPATAVIQSSRFQRRLLYRILVTILAPS